jgi:AcrR family transcriptional regulator
LTIVEAVLYYHLASSPMPRPQLHPTDAMLDAARDLLLEQGSPSATMEAIATASGAPMGSIYHRFASRDELIARLWIRAVYRSQASWVAAMEHDDAKQAALGAAMSIVDFCEEHPGDAQLLAAFRREDLIKAIPEGPLAEELEELNRPVERAVVQLARRLYGRRSRAALDRTLLVVFDLPYGAARRYLITGMPLPSRLRADLASAVAAVIDEPLAPGAVLRRGRRSAA